MARTLEMIDPTGHIPHSSLYTDALSRITLNPVSQQDQEQDTQSPGRVAAFFDLDKTVIATSSAHAFGKEFLHNGLITPTEAVGLYLAKASFMLGGLSNDQMDSSRDQLADMVAGWDVARVREIAAETLHTVVTPTIYAEARELIESHRAAGHDVIIISASATVLVELIAKELGVDTVVGTELAELDGKFTGEISFYCKGPAKADAMRQLAVARDYDLTASYAYSDSATDIPMLEVVGQPAAVNPDRQMKKTALANGWDILSFRNPIPLFQPPTAREITIGSSVLAGLAAVTVGGLWWAKRASRGSA